LFAIPVKRPIELHDIIQAMKRLIPSAPDERVLLAVSGGVDSMVLLSHYQNTAAQVVHFNYHTREMSNRDEAFVMAQATKCGLPCVVIHAPKLEDGNFQEQARSYRYDVLSDLAKTQLFDKVLLAHHQDDAVETLFLHLLRGNSLQHLGLHPTLEWNGSLFERPLLRYSKAQLQEYAATNNIEYVEDASNQSDDYLRNRLRHHVIPMLHNEQPKLHEKAIQLSAQSAAIKDYLNLETTKLVQLKSRSLFQQAAPVLQDHTLLRWCHENHIEPHTNLLQLLKRVLLSKESQSQVQLSNVLWCVVRYDEISFTTLAKPLEFNIEINADGEYVLPNHDIVIISTIKPEQTVRFVELSGTDLSFPLSIRTRLAGDVLSYPYGHKSLSDWLIDRKIPNHQRDQLWVLAKANNILWMPAMEYHITQPASTSLYVQLKESENESTPRRR
jgi:tRNA(Ile)-lysidine synthetase-like protein